MNDILENYELRKKDLTFETWFIEGIQYNFKLEDFEELLGINKENLLIFKKYLVYLDFYRVNLIRFLRENTNYIISTFNKSGTRNLRILKHALNNFKKVVKDDDNKVLLLSFFKKHEHLFCDKNEVRRKKLVPIEYNKRIFRGI